jgi:hypothetical protein
MIAASLLPAIAAHAEPAHPGPRSGDIYEIRRELLSSDQSSDGSSGSATDRDAIRERVIAVRDGGLELEYDLPAQATAEDRARTWQFPVRVFKPQSGPPQLLNSSELKARVDRWLEAAKWTRAACGHWIFTWDAFKIECDPQSVVETLEAFDLSSRDLRDGALYRDSGALEPASLARKTAGPDGAIFTADMKIDPDAVRRGRAESDLVVAEIMGRPMTLEAASRAHATEDISGTISVTLETDAAGNVRRRKKVSKLEIRAADGGVETVTTTETVERRLVTRPHS